MVPASLFFAFLAGVLHVFIFTMESLTWTRPATWKRFGVASQPDAEITKTMAYNQGFYNLFLAIGAFIGVGLVAFGAESGRRQPAGLLSSVAAVPCCWLPPCWLSPDASTCGRPPRRAVCRCSLSFLACWQCCNERVGVLPWPVHRLLMYIAAPGRLHDA